MKRLAALMLLTCLLLSLPALGEDSLYWVDPPTEIRPGKAVLFTFHAALPGDADIDVLDDSGKRLAVLMEDFSAKAGNNSVTWDGKAANEALPSGVYTLRITLGGEQAAAKVTVGEPSPVFLSIVPVDDHLAPGDEWSIQVELSLGATLSMALKTASGDIPLYEEALEAGQHDIPWEGAANNEPLSPGDYVLALRLTDASGFVSNEEQLSITIDAPGAAVAPSAVIAQQSAGNAHSPSDFSVYTCDHEACFFKLPMGVMNEAAIWKAMMEPMTVVKGTQKQVVKVYAEPSEDSAPVGEVTCYSQGLHVLANLENGWSRVEAYSSSIYSSKVKNWAGFFTGYIKTSKLEVKEPDPTYGLLLDKLTQRMYVFKEGKIITELLISTGLVNKKQPYNETPAGEFMVVSRTGGFWSGNMFCDIALRINGGILIHEVPCFVKDGEHIYDYFERLLGAKASHGCIRVQQEESAEGINMRWLWNHLKLNTRVFIWDDVGRSIPVPDSSTPLYYNPDGGQYYHSDQNCSSVKSKYLPLTAFTYGDLENDPYKDLTACPACNPPKRSSEIEALNSGIRQSY